MKQQINFSLLSLFFVSNLYGSTFNFAPEYDTSIKQNLPTSSFTTATLLSSDGKKNNDEKQAYLEFNVTGITENVQSISLFVTVGGTDAGSVNQFSIKKILKSGVTNLPTSTPQLTGNYTWNSPAPVSSQIVTSKTGFTASTVAEFVIPTSFFNGNGHYAIAIIDSNGTDNLNFYSNDSTNASRRPRLSITTSPTTTTSCTNSNLNGSKYIPRAIWAWIDPKDIVNSIAVGGERDKFFTFAEKRNIRTVYLNVRNMLTNYGTASHDTATENNLPAFLNIAASKCISVHFLVGNGGGDSFNYLSDAEAANNAYPTMSKIANNAVSYVRSLSGAKPTALHWDVEPESMGSWTATEQVKYQRLINAFQKVRSILVAASTAATNPVSLMQTADVGYWLQAYYPANGVTVKCDPNNNLVNPQFTTLAVSECLIKVLDQLGIMDYFDVASTTISEVTDEILFASNNLNFNNKKTAIIIGQETIAAAYAGGASHTFDEELRNASLGIKAMEKQLQIIQNNFDNSNYSAFGGRGLQSNFSPTDPTKSVYDYPANDVTGIAVHYYDIYSEPYIIDNF